MTNTNIECFYDVSNLVPEFQYFLSTVPILFPYSICPVLNVCWPPMSPGLGFHSSALSDFQLPSSMDWL